MRLQAVVRGVRWSARDGKKLRKTFPTLAAARGWRADAQVGLRKGTLRAPTPTTLRQAADAWLAGARDGSIRTRSGDAYKPSAIRSYEGSLRNRVLPELGAAKLSAITRVDLQDLADRMLGEGLDPSTIRNTLMPVRAIYRRALTRGEVAVNPTTGLELPAVRGRRDRVADPEEARQLIGALPPDDRAIWATALYAGLRRGELMALRWEDVDLDGRRIRVARSWDVKEAAFVAPKSAAGARSVPMLAVLRTHLLEHRLRTGRSDGFLFGADGTAPFSYSPLVARARRAWRDAGLTPIGLHECRHTFAALLIAAGVTPKASRPSWATRRSVSPSTATATSSRAARTRRLSSWTPTSRAAASEPRRPSPSPRRLRRPSLQVIEGYSCVARRMWAADAQPGSPRRVCDPSPRSRGSGCLPARLTVPLPGRRGPSHRPRGRGKWPGALPGH